MQSKQSVFFFLLFMFLFIFFSPTVLYPQIEVNKKQRGTYLGSWVNLVLSVTDPISPCGAEEEEEVGGMAKWREEAREAGERVPVDTEREPQRARREQW